MEWWIITIIIAVCALVVLVAAYFIIAAAIFNLTLRRKPPSAKALARTDFYIPEEITGNLVKVTDRAKRYFLNRDTVSSVTALSDEAFAVVPKKVVLDGFQKGKLSAYLFSSDDFVERDFFIKEQTFTEKFSSNKWVIIVHGYTSGAKRMLRYAYEYLKRGFNVLLPDLAGHGESDGKYVQMGYGDAFDVKMWVDHIIEMNKNAKILLHGFSMGGASVCTCSAMKRNENVKGIISDSAFSSAKLEYKYQFRYNLKMPLLMFFYPGLRLIAKLVAGFNLKNCNAEEAVKRNETFPMLIIHGKKDKFVPFVCAEILNKACKIGHDFFAVEDAGHVESFIKDYDGYMAKVDALIAKVM